MRLKSFAAVSLCVILAANSLFVSAFETDQFNLPDAPLADIGDEVSDYVGENIRKSIGKLNAEIAEHENCLARNKCGSADSERAKLNELRSEEALARAVFKPLGGGIPPFTNIGTWMESHEFKERPARFKASFENSIYRTQPFNFLTVSETVRLFGAEFGTDKIAHIFQQGYTYYRIVKRAEKSNLSATEAVRKAVKWGRRSEKTFYGLYASGVYSNADLTANYAGFKFYEGLTHDIEIGGKIRPAVVVLKNGFWAFNENANLRENLLKPFISDHFNEALNPSVYATIFGFRSTIRRAVEKHDCLGWRQKYPNRTAEYFEELARNLRLWNGEDYGFRDSQDFVSVGKICFGDQSENSRQGF